MKRYRMTLMADARAKVNNHLRFKENSQLGIEQVCHRLVNLNDQVDSSTLSDNQMLL